MDSGGSNPGGGRRSLEVTLEPEDNRKLANLCGTLDSNIAQLADSLGLDIRRRGGKFRVIGGAEQAQLAVRTLQRLYERADRHIGDMDVLRTLGSEDEPPPATTVVAKGMKSAISPRNESQRRYIATIAAHDITFGIGPAGTGKTFLAVAAAVEALERLQVRRIVLARPAVEAGERIGYLPGDMEQKVNPYLRPLHDALHDLIGRQRAEKLGEHGKIEVAPLGFMRGRTLAESFIILDEGQNTTPAQMQMLLTRIGVGSKVVVTGDITQIDLPDGQISGLVDAQRRLANVTGVAFARFSAGDAVRHPVVRGIINAYER